MSYGYESALFLIPQASNIDQISFLVCFDCQKMCCQIPNKYYVICEDANSCRKNDIII